MGYGVGGSRGNRRHEAARVMIVMAYEGSALYEDNGNNVDAKIKCNGGSGASGIGMRKRE